MTDLAWVLVVLAALGAPLAALAVGARVHPTPRLVYAVLGPAALSLGVLVARPLLVVVGAVDAALVVVALADLVSLPRRRVFQARRRMGRVASLAKPHAVALEVMYHGSRALSARIRDGAPNELNAQPAELSATLAPRSRNEFHYALRPNRRGAFEIARVHLRAGSRWGFWQRLIDLEVRSAVAVYPDLQQLSQYALLARTNRLSLLGVRRTRRVGQDHDFERLRDYTIDDNHKHIEWRATARRRKLTVRQYQASQSQRVIFLLDCGRMMTSESAGLSLLDHALNAALMLSYVALRQGDAVGILTFSDEIHEFVPPRGGMRQMNRLLHAAFDRFPRLVESRYDLAFRHLASHCRKRSLVVLVTHVLDEVNAAQLERYLKNLAGRHLPLGVLLRDHRLFEAVEEEYPAEDRLWRAAAAADILAWRHQVLRDLTSKGVLTLDVFPEQMTAPLVNRYLEIKARHLL